MKKAVVFTLVAALSAQMAAPVLAASILDDNTMLGWQRTSRPAAMAYMHVPFQAGRSDFAQPRAGLMITPASAYHAGDAVVRSASTGLVDLSFTGHDFRQPWALSLNVSNAVAWTSNPKAEPKNATYLFDNGVSWVIVGVATAGIIAGTIVLSERKPNS